MLNTIEERHAIIEDHQKIAREISPAEIEFRNILMPTDFSNCSDRALRYAIAIARRYGATLHLFHWVDPRAYQLAGAEVVHTARDASWRDIQQLESDLVAKCLLRNIQIKLLVADGDLSEILPRIITQQKIDLIVIGTHGRTGWKKLILGSVAERIFRQATSPVLTIGPNVTQSRVADDRPRDILFPTDFSPQSQGAERYAFSLAKKYSARLTLLHVLEHSSKNIHDERDRLLQARARLRKLATFHEAAIESTDCLVISGRPADSILGTAVQKGADLIVLGMRASQGVSDRLMWSNAYRIVCDSHCPVLSVRTLEAA